MKIFIYSDMRATAPIEHEDVTPHEFLTTVDDFAHTIAESEDELTYWNFTDFGEGSISQSSDALTVQALVLSVDEDADVNFTQLIAAADKTGFAYCCYTDFQHSSSQFSAVLIVPLEDPIPAKTFIDQGVTGRFVDLLGISVNNGSFSLTQRHPLPACQENSQAAAQLTVRNNDNLLNVKNLPKVVAITQSKKEPNEAEIADMIYSEIFNSNLIFYKNQFYTYGQGIWEPFSNELYMKTTRAKYRQCFDNKTLKQARTNLEYDFFHEEFPKNTIAPSHDNLPAVPLISLANLDVDPLSGKTFPHSPQHYLRNQLPFRYDPEATCETWDSFLAQTFDGDVDGAQKIALLEEWIGYLMIPDCRFQKMLWLVGQGGLEKVPLLMSSLNSWVSTM